MTVMTAAAIAVSTVLATSADPPARHAKHAVRDGPVQRISNREQDRGGHDLERGNQPQVGPEHLPAPLGPAQQPADHWSLPPVPTVVIHGEPPLAGHLLPTRLPGSPQVKIILGLAGAHSGAGRSGSQPT